MSNNDWAPKVDTPVYSPPKSRRRGVLTVVLVLLAAFVLLGPGRNYYVQWSAAQKGAAALQAKDYAEVFRQMKIMADAGNVDAKGQLGALYWRGEGVAQNDSQAVYWWKKSADGGNAEAIAALGQAYLMGRGVEKDSRLAESFSRKAADKDNMNGQYQLGVLYWQGQGVAQSYEQALYWWRKAADQGSGEAEYSLGQVYLNGQGVERNDQLASKFSRQSADKAMRTLSTPSASCMRRVGVLRKASSRLPHGGARRLTKEAWRPLSVSDAPTILTKASRRMIRPP
ncbi:tetratricopeptide repeat protein [Mesorhizobium sp. LSJC285A00]|uniref:tetratricopeptide repeat protein n=1 Tax=Mesorhizobium sp. LSJC285A00 TaxID=1287338 RepID=UPI0012EB8813|nr:tetratricopeptide repeat protein [Mesorhizobium sp. LSJC285A00]